VLEPLVEPELLDVALAPPVLLLASPDEACALLLLLLALPLPSTL
jgi:hypothetical protein